MSVLFLFIDGIGIGDATEHNPFHVTDLPGFELLSGGKMTADSSEIRNSNHLFKHIDANLAMEGLPQSGTGQASLFCGINASKIVGKHFGPYPHSKNKMYLEEQSLFNDVIKLGKQAHFINAYPKPFFEFAEKRNRWSCSSLMAKGAGQKLHTEESIRNGFAITAEIKQDYWKAKLNIDIPQIQEKEAANRLLKAADSYDVVMYEFYLTDKAGHEQKMESAVSVLQRLDNFLQEIIKQIGNHTLVLTSDHGNVEDLSVKTHTRNLVPLFVYGQHANLFYSINDLTEVKAAILKCVDKKKTNY